MILLLAFAFLSGIITILSPCILPVLPIVLSGTVGTGKAKPLGIIAGFVLSFTLFTLTLSMIVQALGISSDAMRIVAVVILVLFGLVMVIPWLKDRFQMLFSSLANIGSRTDTGVKTTSNGFWGGFPIGLSLGLVWSPCVGPIMASVIALAATQKVSGSAVFITLAYSLGTSIPMFVIMVGGRELLKRVPGLAKNTETIQKVFGALMILVGIVIGLGWDRSFENMVLKAFPNYGSGLTAIENNKLVRQSLNTLGPKNTMMMKNTTQLSKTNSFVFSGIADNAVPDTNLPDYGSAPELIKNLTWLNSPVLNMQALKGKVVLIDFWTYSCINCIRTLPYLDAWYQAYKDKGFVLIGVHTPEFEFEKKTENVKAANKDLSVSWPVVQDNNYQIWNLYHNQYWPADYLIDSKGHIRYFHFGEGDYAEAEQAIQKLLKEAGVIVSGNVTKPMYDINANTPETYLGYNRATGYASIPAPVSDISTSYKPDHNPANGEWTLNGSWTIGSDSIVPDAAGTLEFTFNAKNVFLVITPEEKNASMQVLIDGKAGPDTADVKNGILQVQENRLYQLAGLKSAGTHRLTLKINGKLRLYAFTFG